MKVINSFVDHFLARYESCEDFGALHSLNNEAQNFLMILEREEQESYKDIFLAIKEKAEEAKLRIFFDSKYF